ncbi:hypothetical protein, partial [Bacteroides sp. OF04-15BH]|uniref:hypothetical protein n=1 Tax=Bacteroides sp. OF04-15BH TaxID=2292281 RepID=UPI0018F6E96E
MDNGDLQQFTSATSFLPETDAVHTTAYREQRNKNTYANWDNLCIFIFPKFYIRYIPKLSYSYGRTDGNYLSAEGNRLLGRQGLDSIFMTNNCGKDFLNLLATQDRNRTHKWSTNGHMDTDINLKAWNLNYFNLSLFYEYNHERGYDMQHYNLLTANQTADKRNRYDNRPKSKYIYRIMIDWPFISNKKQKLFFTYGYTQEFHSSERMLYRLDRLGNEWMPDKAPIGLLPSATDLYRHCMDSLNSYHRSYFYWFHSPRLRWYYKTEDLQIDAELPLNITYERLNEWRPKGEQSNIRREVFTWPNITVTFKGVELHFDMQHRSPSQTLMLDVCDDSNPLAVYLGNPSLKSSYEYYLGTKWAGFKQEKTRLWSLGLSLYTINNAIGQLRRFNPQTGGYTYTPWNIDGNRGLWFAGNFSQYIDQYRHWFLKIDTDIRLDRSVDFTNTGTTDDFQKSIVQNLHVSPNIGIDYRSLKWHAGFKASADWERLTSAQEGFETLSQVDFLYTLNLDAQLP